MQLVYFNEYSIFESANWLAFLTDRKVSQSALSV